MTNETDLKKHQKKEYQKPELIRIDDPAFDETGQGLSIVIHNAETVGLYGIP
jgi:hypothetical protein